MTVTESESRPGLGSALFSFRGRIGRGWYWISLAIAFGALLTATLLGGAAMSSTGSPGPVVLLAFPAIGAFIWIFAAATVKRLRDAGWPAAAQIAWGLAPMIWIAATLEFIEYIGIIIALGMITLFVTPGILPSKPSA